MKNQDKKEENEEEHNKFNQGGFKLLNKPYLYVNFFIELNCFLNIFLGVLIFEIEYLKKIIECLNLLFKLEIIFFNNLIIFVRCLLFICYQF